MHISYVDQPALRLITVKATDCGPGIPASWQSLEAQRDVKGRKSYGVITGTPNGPEYYAGLVSEGEIEERTTGLPVLEVAGGPCARVKLMDWQQHIPEISSMFQQLMDSVDQDTSRPNMEFYRSQTELHLIVPVKAK